MHFQDNSGQTNAADIFFLNHEYCISDRGTPLEDKYYVFRAKPERMKLLEQMGTDIVSIANNHIYDYGADAMDDTINLLDQAKITHVGGGTNLDESKAADLLYYQWNQDRICGSFRGRTV